MTLTRVYAPETNEPFDVPASKAADLILLKGWTKSPVTRVAVPEEAPAPTPVVAEAEEQETAPTWRNGRNRARIGRGMKTSGSDEAVV